MAVDTLAASRTGDDVEISDPYALFDMMATRTDPEDRLEAVRTVLLSGNGVHVVQGLLQALHDAPAHTMEILEIRQLAIEHVRDLPDEVRQEFDILIPFLPPVLTGSTVDSFSFSVVLPRDQPRPETESPNDCVRSSVSLSVGSPQDHLSDLAPELKYEIFKQLKGPDLKALRRVSRGTKEVADTIRKERLPESENRIVARIQRSGERQKLLRKCTGKFQMVGGALQGLKELLDSAFAAGTYLETHVTEYIPGGPDWTGVTEIPDFFRTNVTKLVTRVSKRCSPLEHPSWLQICRDVAALCVMLADTPMRDARTVAHALSTGQDQLMIDQANQRLASISKACGHAPITNRLRLQLDFLQSRCQTRFQELANALNQLRKALDAPRQPAAQRK
jgi:hypothetical protein